MNARVVLLVVVTGLFMTAWDGDQAAMQAAIVKRDQKQATQLAMRTALNDLQRTVEDVTTESDATLHELTALAYADSSDQDVGDSDSCGQSKTLCPNAVPLPPGISAGIYKAVNQAGEAVEVTVPEDKAPGARVREFYMADSRDGDRWYLIRIVR